MRQEDAFAQREGKEIPQASGQKRGPHSLCSIADP